MTLTLELGLTRPELCVLLAYAKLDLDAEVLASALPDDPTFASLLAGYFPHQAVEAFPEERRYVGPGPWLNVLREPRR